MTSWKQFCFSDGEATRQEGGAGRTGGTAKSARRSGRPPAGNRPVDLPRKSTRPIDAGRPFAGEACGRPVGWVNSGQILQPLGSGLWPARG